MQKIMLSAAAAFGLLASAASAADLPARASPAPVFSAPPVFTWTGLYVGVNAGGAFRGNRCGRFQPAVGGVPVAGFANNCGSSGNNGSFTYGAQIGYNWQYNNLVLGVEADINGLTGNGGNRNSTVVFAGPPAGLAGQYVFNSSRSNNYFGTVRGRVGYAWDHFLLYGTGGLAYGSGGRSSSVGFFPGIGPFPAAPSAILTNGGGSGNRIGWALGAGAEYAFTNNWSVKGEYLYVNTGRNKSSGFSCTDVVAGTCAALPAGTTFANGKRGNNALNIVRVGLNYRF